jgi:hypothetical protein
MTRLSGKEIIMGKSYPTHVTIPLDEYSELTKMLIKLWKKARPKLEAEICEIIDKVDDLAYREESKYD